MRRSGWVIATCVATLGAALSAFFHPLPKPIWRQRAVRALCGASVRRPSHVLAGGGEAAKRAGAVPRRAPLPAQGRAHADQTVCRNRRAKTVDGIAIGDALDRDSRGRPHPVWRDASASPTATSS